MFIKTARRNEVLIKMQIEQREDYHDACVFQRLI